MELRFSIVGGCGTLTLREEGPRVRFTAVMDDDGRGLYKVYLTGGGPRLLLGTLVPENGRIRLQRTLSTGELLRNGLWPPEGCVAELAFAFRKETGPVRTAWASEPQPSRLFADRVLAGAAEKLTGVLMLRTADGFRLAMPYSKDQAFPLSPLFCFGHMELLNEKIHIVFSFHARGIPIFPVG